MEFFRRCGEIIDTNIITEFFQVTTYIFTEMSFFCHQIEVDFVQAVGVIVEYDPMHRGHAYLLQQIRSRLGADTGVICAMSGDFVQRGGFALVRREARAAAAVESGADLVLEVPLPWAAAPAERFADGGVQVLLGTGMLGVLAFGSECGDAGALMETARGLCSPEFEKRLRKEAVGQGESYAACRERAARAFLGQERGALLQSPNNILGIEYCKALLRRQSSAGVMTVRRTAAAHNALGGEAACASASAIRALIEEGREQAALAAMTPAMRRRYLAEVQAGRAPVVDERCERAILAQLRSMTKEDFTALDSGREGIGNRLYAAVRPAVSVEEILRKAKTKRYAYARLRRMVLWAYLGLEVSKLPQTVPYLRVLAANGRGRELLSAMRKTARLPVLTKPADVRRLGAEAEAVFEQEARCADLYALAYPDLSAAGGGRLWRETPVMV